MRQLVGQQRLDLFCEERRVPFDFASVDHVTKWLVSAHKCTEAVRRYVLGLYAEFDGTEAFERSKALPSLDGLHRVPGWELQDAVDYYQIYSHGIGYHTVLDRAWAARQGLPKDDVLRVIEWDYAKGAPVFGSAYLCDSCRNLVWHRNGDGYCCCMAPGMERINARTRKVLGTACRFYERRNLWKS